MIISHNLLALNANGQFNKVTNARKKNTEKLSSGYRINRAADDAAGLAMSEKMRRQIRGLTQASENVQEGIGYVQTADGALVEVDEMLQRINELAVKASNGTMTDDDRSYINSEVQQLKSEMDRIFTTTSFNERLIWDQNSVDRKIVGYEKRQALNVTQRYEYFDITNENCGVVPKSNYANVKADDSGISFSWTGYNGQNYQTDTIDWDTLKANDYSFTASSLYSDPKFFASDGTTPLIDFTYKFEPIATATYADMAKSLNGTTVSIYYGATMRAQFEDASGSKMNNSLVSQVSSTINYSAAYDSFAGGAGNGYSFDAGQDATFRPSATTGNMTVHPNYTTYEDARTDSTGFEFSFDVDGIGTVKAKLNGIRYYSNDTSDEAEHIWWDWDWYYNSDHSKHYYKATHTYSTASTLAGMMNMLTGTGAESTPGLLTAENGGCSKSGGIATLSFGATYANGSFGSLTMTVNVSSSDTEESFFNKIKDGFNSSTVLDLYTNDSDERSREGSTRPGSAKTNLIDNPIYQATNELFIQAGTEAGQHISIFYDALTINFLGMDNTNVLTAEDAGAAIDEVKAAMAIVNGQRADFGAYQNRLEHTYKNLDNVVENDTAAESRIRDTDMADSIMKEAMLNIIQQTGTSMMAQANQSTQGVLSLLQ